MDPTPSLLRIVVAGFASRDVARVVEQESEGRVEVVLTTDIEGALAVRDGRADFFLGVCQSGAGGALAMAIGLLGRDRCVTLSRMGKALPPADIVAVAATGKVGFGIAVDQVQATIPALIGALMAKGR